MADTFTQRYALVTGANKGIGFEICRQLASKGIVVILASRDEKRGLEARERLLKESRSISDGDVVFHQLDVVDPASVVVVADFIKTKFGRLDILAHPFHPKTNGKMIETLKDAKECIETNYYGTKRITEALIPLLQKSDSPTIVNVSSALSTLLLQPNEWAKGVFSSEDSSLNEEKVEEVLHEFHKDFIDGKLQQNNWPPNFAAYKVSKEAVNAYTRIIARKYPSFCINSVCPGFVRTDICYSLGQLSEAEGAEAPVKLALLPRGGPSGSFFFREEALSLY
uniref:Menthol dehydrogenase n=1 Tax=Mentha piperita TaxID=34256 RepID=A0A1S5R238_MENPI|nr:menthol dehydrogenase [Mentha x piperita]